MVLIAGFVIPRTPARSSCIRASPSGLVMPSVSSRLSYYLRSASSSESPKKRRFWASVLALAAPSTPDRRAVSFLVSGEPESHASREGVSVAHQDVRVAADSRLMA